MSDSARPTHHHDSSDGSSAVLPEQRRELEVVMKDKGRLPEGGVVSGRCANLYVDHRGRLGCVLHDTAAYPEGCAAFPANPDQWYLVAETCGYYFRWVGDRPRRAGKERRRARA